MVGKIYAQPKIDQTAPNARTGPGVKTQAASSTSKLSSAGASFKTIQGPKPVVPPSSGPRTSLGAFKPAPVSVPTRPKQGNAAPVSAPPRPKQGNVAPVSAPTSAKQSHSSAPIPPRPQAPIAATPMQGGPLPGPKANAVQPVEAQPRPEGVKPVPVSKPAVSEASTRMPAQPLKTGPLAETSKLAPASTETLSRTESGQPMHWLALAKIFREVLKPEQDTGSAQERRTMARNLASVDKATRKLVAENTEVLNVLNPSMLTKLGKLYKAGKYHYPDTMELRLKLSSRRDLEQLPVCVKRLNLRDCTLSWDDRDTEYFFWSTLLTLKKRKPGLEYLELPKCALRSAPIFYAMGNVFEQEGGRGFDELKELVVERRYGSATYDIPGALVKCCPKLETLVLRGIAPDDGTKAISSLPNLKKLVWEDVQESHPRRGMDLFGNLGVANSVQEYHCSGEYVGIALASLARHFPNLKSLTVLDETGYVGSGQAYESLRSHENLSSVTVLSKWFDPPVLYALALLPKLDTFKALNFSDNIEHLVDVFLKTALTDKIKTLQLPWEKIPPASLARLRQSMPDCEFEGLPAALSAYAKDNIAPTPPRSSAGLAGTR